MPKLLPLLLGYGRSEFIEPAHEGLCFLGDRFKAKAISRHLVLNCLSACLWGLVPQNAAPGGLFGLRKSQMRSLTAETRAKP